MASEPDNLVMAHLRELRDGQGRLDRKLDVILEELHDFRAEAAADRGRVSGVDHTVQALQRRLLRTDERLDGLSKQVELLKAGGGQG